MVTYPITVKRNMYRGADARKKAKAASENRIAAELESHINAKLLSQQEPIKIYMYGHIASETGISAKLIHDLCYSIDGGSNGFTAIKHGMSYEDAMRAQSSGE